MKRFSCKTTAILTAVFFISSGIFVPTSFASVNELILNGAQRPVPTLTLEQANAQTTPVIENEIPSGVAVQNENPLSLATPSLQTEGDVVPEGAIQVHEGESIQSAINQAEAGDIVYVHAGTYHESITLKRGVNLQGESRASTIIDGQSQYRDVILVQGDNLIEGLTVTGGAAYNGGPTSAVRIEGNNVRFSGNSVINNGGYGVYLRAGSDIVIERSFFKGNNLAIQHPHGSVTGVVIQYNTMVNNNIAINILDGVTPRIENNIITGSTFCAIYEFNWNAYASGQLSRGFATVANNTFFSNAWRPTYYGSSTPPAVEALTAGNIQVDPKFNDPAHGDYRLIPGSPAIGRGAYPDPVVPEGWMRAASNPDYAFRTQEDGAFFKMLVLNLGSGQQTQVAELPAGGPYPYFQDIVDISPDGATVIYSTMQSAEASIVCVQRISDLAKKILIGGVLRSVTFIPNSENALLDFQDGKSILLRLSASSAEFPQILEEHKPNGVVSYFNASNGALERVAIHQTGGIDPLPSVEIVRPVITQAPNPMNQWTLKFNQSMKGVRYEVQFRTSLMSGDWQAAGSFVADHYGEISWQDPVPDRGSTIFYRVVAKEMTTAADLLTQINLLYFNPAFGMIEDTHGYPLEGWIQRDKTQPSNFGFYAYLLATIATGDLVTSTISKTEAIGRLNTMMDHLLVDQADPNLGFMGLLPWLEYTGTDWQRMEGSYGHQVSFEDNTNFTNALAVAYGALLDESLANNLTVHGTGPGDGGLLGKIDAFIANQREGYLAMYNEGTQTFAQTMQISDGSLSGGIVLFGAESSAPLLFLILQYGDTFPASAYAKLNFATRTYRMQDLSFRTVVAPFSGAFQMYWPALLMPESENPDLRDMLETYTDVQLDFANRNGQPGLLSASYDVVTDNLLNRTVSAFSWMGDDVHGAWEKGHFRVTSSTNAGIGVAFTDGSKFSFEGSTMQLRYSSTTAVPNARIEFKRLIGGVLTTVYTEVLSLENTGGAERTVSFTLPLDGVLGELTEVVFATSGGGALDVTLCSFDTDRIAYNFPLGINEIALGSTVETTPSVYNLGAAYMFRPAEVEALLQGLIADHRDLVSDHGLWEGMNMASGKVVNEQVFNNVMTFVLGMTGTGPSYMTRYLENKGLIAELDSIWNSQTPVSVIRPDNSTDFSYSDGSIAYKGTSWALNESVRASDRQIRITYQSDTTITGAKFDLKYSLSGNEPVYSVLFDLPATGGVPGEVTLNIPENFLYWYIAEMVVVFPDAQGFPSATISRIVLAPEGVSLPPVVVLDAATPTLINTKTLAVNYTVDGIAKIKLFENLQEGANILAITEGQTVVNWNVMVDTIAPEGTIVINNNDAYTVASSVIITMDVSDVTSGLDKMRFSVDGGVTWGLWEVFASTKVITLSIGDGVKTIQCQVIDKAGLVSTTLEDTITLDETPPLAIIRNRDLERQDDVPFPGRASLTSSGRSVADAGGNILMGADIVTENGFVRSGRAYLLDGNPISPTFGDVLVELWNPTPAANDYFGSVVEVLEGGYLLVSSKWDSAAGQSAGAVYVFDGNSQHPTYGQVVHTFYSPNAGQYQYFGSAIERMGKNIAVGSPGEGRVYLFNGDITSPDFGSVIRVFSNPSASSPTGDGFGSSLKAVGNHLCIGASREYSGSVSYAGIAYLFDADPASPSLGQLLHTFQDPTPRSSAGFGFALETVGDNIIIGGEYASDGEAYMFDGNTSSPTFGNLLTTFRDPEGVFSANSFGHSITALDSKVIIGDTSSYLGGKIYIFDGDPESLEFGALTQIIANPSPVSADQFGAEVAVVGNILLVATPGKDIGGISDAGIFSTYKVESTSHAIMINNKADYTATADITLNLNVADATSGLDQMRFSEDGGMTWTDWENFVSTRSLVLSDPDGTKEVQCQFKDKAGNSSSFSDTIILDRLAPAGSVSINSDALYATSTSMILNLTASDIASGADRMRFSTDGGVSWTLWESIAPTRALTLPDKDGTREVQYQLIDKAGNTATFTDTIILDRVAPSGAVTINNQDAYVNTPFVTMTLSVSDAISGVDQMRFSVDGGGTWSDWENYGSSRSLTLPSGDGSKDVRVQISDLAGNTGTLRVNVTLDTMVPAGMLTINSNMSRTGATSVILNLSGSDMTSGVETVSFSTDGGNTWSDWEDFAMTKTLSLPTGDGEKEVRGRLMDRAGNISDLMLDTIILDSTILLLEDQSFSILKAVRKTMVLGPLLSGSGGLLTYSFGASYDLSLYGQFSLFKNQLTYAPMSGFIGSGVITVQSSDGVNTTQHNVNLQVTAPPISTSNDPSLNYQYGLSITDAIRAWNLSTGSGVVVAVIDSGISMTHPDLDGNIFTNSNEIAGDGVDNDGNGFVDDVHGWDFVNADNNPSDDYGHGTHVAGIIAAEKGNGLGGSGIAPDVEIVPIKVLNSLGSGSTIDSAFRKVAQGILYAVQTGAKVINMSVGTWASNISASVVQLLKDAINAAHAAGVVVVAASGNDNANVAGFAPASFDNVIAVSATGSSDLRASSYGSYFSNWGEAIDFSAPGENIYSTYWKSTNPSAYSYLDGTSMAAPFVAGLSAMMLAQDPTASDVDVFRRLKFSSADLGTSGWDQYFGYGRIDAFRALSYDYYDNGVIKTQWLESPDENGWNRLSFDAEGYLTGGAYVGISGIAGLGAALANAITPVVQPIVSLSMSSISRLSAKQFRKFSGVNSWSGGIRGQTLTEEREDDSAVLKSRLLLPVDQKKNYRTQKAIRDESKRNSSQERLLTREKTENQKMIQGPVQNELIFKSIWGNPLTGTALRLSLSTWSAGDM